MRTFKHLTHLGTQYHLHQHCRQLRHSGTLGTFRSRHPQCYAGADDASGVFVDAIPLQVVRPDPRHFFGIVCRDELPAARRAEIVGDHEVILHAVTDTVDAIEAFDQRADFDVQPGLFSNLASGRIDKRFPELDPATGKGPLTFSWLMPAFDEEDLAVLQDDRTYANYRGFGKLTRHEL